MKNGRRSVPGYSDTIFTKTNTDREHIPLPPGIALTSQCLLSYRQGTDAIVVGAFLSMAGGRTLEHKGGRDASPTARSFHCRSRLDAGNGLRICAQRGGSESSAPQPTLCSDHTLSATIACGAQITGLLMGLTATHFSQEKAMVGLEFWFRFRRPIFADETIRLE